jgi:hypothetical protein
MTLGALVLLILVFGFLFWLIQAVIPEPPKRILHVVLAVILVLLLARALFPGIGNMRVL